MSVGSDGFPEALYALEPATLEEVDRRSALRRRVDTKYVIPRERLADVVAGLDDYEVLEIDGHRNFLYESVYFDTPDLRCFRDHVEGAERRFKARTRYYRETEKCFIELKVKVGDETTKRQRDCDVTEHGVISEASREFLREAVTELIGEEPPDDLAAVLSTSFRRATLSAREGGERATIDLELVLRTMDDRTATLRDDYALVETKSEAGEGELDAALEAAGCEPASISKYRLGVGLLLAEDRESAQQELLRQRFV
jgi:VTC domain-containing protein